MFRLWRGGRQGPKHVLYQISVETKRLSAVMIYIRSGLYDLVRSVARRLGVPRRLCLSSP
jgi:hypothetical protein